MINVCLLGGTGSIGTQVLDLVRKDSKYHLYAFSFGKNLKQAINIIEEFSPEVVCALNQEDADYLKTNYPFLRTFYGDDGLLELVSLKVSNYMVINALVGSVGLKPTYVAIENKYDVYLANKETLVVGGELITCLAEKNNCKIGFQAYKKHFPNYIDFERLRASGFKIVRETNGNYNMSTPKIGHC